MNKTRIEWVKNPDGTQGYTWNPITGCLNGCSYCYARKLANGRLKSRYSANTNTAPQIGPVSFKLLPEHPFYPRFWEDRLLLPTDQQKPRGIFVCDMSDLFGIGIPKEWTELVLLQIKRCSQHRFYLLTKQPQNLLKFSPFPDNCWAGVTVCNPEMYKQALAGLAVIEARVKYLSIEPFLERIPMSPPYELSVDEVKQVIIGGQSGRDKFYPPEEWIQEIESACDRAGVPVFEKANLRKVWYNYPRREFPIRGDDYANTGGASKRERYRC